jgi:hypothetical protein
VDHPVFFNNDKDNIIEGMAEQTNRQKDSGIYYRLVALWVICEAFAGGILHGIKLPFTGMIISSLAVMCIILIAWYVPDKGAILKATLIVAVFKLLLSPQSPPPAYIAVFFQGMMGQLLFLNKRVFKLSAILLAVLSLVESAIQRILVLLILGSDFWKAVNQFIQKLTNQKTLGSYSNVIAIGYIVLHAIVGLLIGIYFANLVKKSQHWGSSHPEFIIDVHDEKLFEPRKSKKRKRTRLIFIILWVILLALLMQAYFNPRHSFITVNEITGLIIRFVLILAAWYLFLAPLVMVFIKKILVSQRLKKKHEMNKVMEILPQTKYIFIASWRLSAIENGYNRLRLFLKILLINILSEPEV